MAKKLNIHFAPATQDRWNDLQIIFGKNGACAGCWCMWFRIKRSIWEKQRGEENRKALKRLVDSGNPPGILAYVDDQPAGWCCVGAREDFVVLENSRILKRVDEKPVWSIVCLFVARPFRRRGITVALINEAVRYASSHGAKIVEGYPVEPRKHTIPDIYGYHGFVSAFKKAAFREVARRSETRPIMRKLVKQS